MHKQRERESRAKTQGGGEPPEKQGPVVHVQSDEGRRGLEKMLWKNGLGLLGQGDIPALTPESKTQHETLGQWT